MSQNTTKSTEKQQQPQELPKYQFNHSVTYAGKRTISRNGVETPLQGSKMTLCVLPSTVNGIYIVSHSIVSSKDVFSKKRGRQITSGRIEKHLKFLSTRVDYPCLGEYKIDTGLVKEPEAGGNGDPIIAVVKHYEYAEVVIVDSALDPREQMDIVMYIYETGAVDY